MNEFQAAVGLAQLKHIDNALAEREAIDRRYRELLADITGIRCLPSPPSKRHNYSYFPILVDSDYPLSRDELYDRFREHGIYTRRYFYPLISEFPMYRALPSAKAANLTEAGGISSRVICLPIYPGISDDVLQTLVSLIRN